MKKKKKKLKIYRVLALILVIITVFAVGTLTYFNVLPYKYLVPGVVVLAFIIFFIICMLCRKTKNYVKIISVLLTIIIMGVELAGINYAFGTITFFNKIFDIGVRTETYEVYVLDKSKYKTVKDLNNKNISVYSPSDKAIEKLNKEISFKEKDYDNIDEAVSSVLEKENDAIFVNSGIMEIYKESYDKVKDLRLVGSYEVTIKSENKLKTVKVTEKPFAVYLSGIDISGKVNKSARSDVNLLAVVNPIKGKVLIISIPRDYYVTLSSKKAKDKLTHAGIYGVLESANTVGDLLDLDVNYYARVNFTSFIKIINSLGGIEVNVDKPDYRYNDAIDCGSNTICEQNSQRQFGTKMIYIKPGKQTLSGEKALAYARNRHQFAGGDNARGKHQSQIIEGIINKAVSPAILTKYNKLLSSLQNGVMTNIEQKDITDLVNMQLDKNIKWQIETISLTGTDSYNTTYSTGGLKAYVMKPDEKSIANAKIKISEIMKAE